MKEGTINFSSFPFFHSLFIKSLAIFVIIFIVFFIKTKTIIKKQSYERSKNTYRRVDFDPTCYSIDCNKIDSEISHLQTDAVSEEGVAKKTLDEKLRTKAGLEAMRKKQHSIQLELGLIDATLESMETIAITAETNDASAKDVRDDLQRVISSTTLAIEETLCEHSV